MLGGCLIGDIRRLCEKTLTHGEIRKLYLDSNKENSDKPMDNDNSVVYENIADTRIKL
jgi:hypothetical protein